MTFNGRPRYETINTASGAVLIFDNKEQKFLEDAYNSVENAVIGFLQNVK